MVIEMQIFIRVWSHWMWLLRGRRVAQVEAGTGAVDNRDDDADGAGMKSVAMGDRAGVGEGHEFRFGHVSKVWENSQVRLLISSKGR